MSEAELDAFVGKLRTDKNRVVAPATQSRGRGDMLSERLHAGRRPLVSSVPEEVATHAWYVAPGNQVSGPHDVAALKSFLERGELGADSLCWREGFSAWTPLCQVPELAEALVPLPQEKLPTPAESTGEPSGSNFALKGAEALRSLPGDAAAPVTEPAVELLRVEATGPVAVSTEVAASQVGAAPQPGTVAAEVSASLQFVTVPAEVAGPSVEPVGTHAVLGREAGRVEVRWRGGVWLALLGGVTGGVSVAIVMGLMGSADGRALLARMTSRETWGVSATATPGAGSTARGVDGAQPAPGNTGSGATPGGVGNAAAVGATGSGATPGAVGAASGTAVPGASPGAASVLPGTSGAGAAPGAVVASAGAKLGTPGVGTAGGTSLAGVTAGTLDRGGAVPVLAASGGRKAPAATSAPASVAESLETEDLPEEAPVARAAVSAPSAEKRPAAPPPLAEADFENELDAEAAPAVDTAPAEKLGPDEAFERELASPPPGAGARAERSVYVPPDPSKPPAELAQSDIFEVVLAKKDDISACASEQQPPTPGAGGRVVVRWSILPSGQVSDVVTETASLKGTPIARCIEGKVRAWTFPKHQEQGGPVRFPFVF
ncbi:AgmX/PglI C-terminal domain-containing protein [Pyxidicoccus xibeiensis]|uniref:AgmX/PglI C-terminal domain-containing protein n=1 Tax=Pyxidicoccus xibeiensis TaxID=2906759 RepID=UPI0020A702FE|nr:AgmX/PglI C-terminal domain-containing protein [Pyxidicoccus xibeiensis]MCP3141075.1 AgmX/PglI C-terminal domain-containing protein [Pyxidicoccus xibeiensis]